MFDKNTLIIGYDETRGETRGKHKKGDSWEDRGHCIDCTACVQVCPMGIDIRDGLQMECIACGLCIDACDTVMEKLELPKDLIRYDTPFNQEQRAENSPETSSLLRARTVYYTILLSLVSAVILYGLINRSSLEMHVLRDRNPLFVLLSDGSVRNGYDVKILNKTHDDQTYSLTVAGMPDLAIRVQGYGDISANNLPVFADSVGHFRVFITAPNPGQRRSPVEFTLTNTVTNEGDRYEGLFVSEK
jgi:cytochrome c oxidase accessory protein FixG